MVDKLVERVTFENFGERDMGLSFGAFLAGPPISLRRMLNTFQEDSFLPNAGICCCRLHTTQG